MIEYVCTNRKCRATHLETEMPADGRCSMCYGDSHFEREIDEDTFEPLLKIAARNLKRLSEMN
jgi:hypothetical protein